MSDTARLSAPAGAATAAETAEVSDDAKAVLKPEATARDYLDALLAADLAADAVQVLAACLPPRQAVWWASKCAAQAPPPPPAKPSPAADAEHARAVAGHHAALTAARTWAARPTDDNRRAAFAAAEAAGVGTPAGLAGAAAFFADGSLGPPNVPRSPATARLREGGGRGGPTGGRPHRPAVRPGQLRQFLTLGLAVEAGTDRWPEAAEPLAPPPPPPPPAVPPRTEASEPETAPPPARLRPPPPPTKRDRGWY
ncbi:MAG: hypothetical protein U0871_24520 [Gemmataceae bacterium]